MAQYNGTTIGVYIDDSLVAASTNCTLDMSMDTYEVTSKDSGGKREIQPGTTSWTISGDFLDSVGDVNYDLDDLLTLVNNRTLISVRVDDAGTSQRKYTGQGYLTSVNGSWPNEDVASGSFTIEGTGTLTVVVNT